MTENKIYKYNDKEITFQLTGQEGVMINATQMAKAFGKLPNDYLRLPSTQELIKAIARKSRKSDYQAVTTKPGMPKFGGGTWMCEDLAPDFAQWLSVDFKLWCNDRIKELLTIGFTATPDTLEKILTNPDLIIGLATKLKEAREEIQELQPKAEYYDQLVDKGHLTNFRDTAKELNIIKEQAFTKMLVDNKYLYRDQFNQLRPYAKYVHEGVFEMRDYINKHNGRAGVQTLVTTKGKLFFMNLLNKK